MRVHRATQYVALAELTRTSPDITRAVPARGVLADIALFVGIYALRKIAASRGRLGGRGFAVAGVTISSIILAFVLASSH